MHITQQDGSSSTKKKDKDLAFKASQEKGKARIEYASSSDDEIDDTSLALMVRRTAKMLKKLNKSGIKFDGKKNKFFTSTRSVTTQKSIHQKSQLQIFSSKPHVMLSDICRSQP